MRLLLPNGLPIQSNNQTKVALCTVIFYKPLFCSKVNAMRSLVAYFFFVLVTVANAAPLWSTFPGRDYDAVVGNGFMLSMSSRTHKSYEANSTAACQNTCTIGCDFVVYDSDLGECYHKLADRTGYKGVIFKGQTNKETAFLPGEIRGTPIISEIENVTNRVACASLCEAEEVLISLIIQILSPPYLHLITTPSTTIRIVSSPLLIQISI